MTALEYLKRKNKIVYRVTGTVLIPKSQLIPHNTRIDMFRASRELAGVNCTYCIGTKSILTCEGCPMKQAGNECNKDEDNTYDEANDAWQEKATQKDRAELKRLGDKFKREYREDKRLCKNK